MGAGRRTPKLSPEQLDQITNQVKKEIKTIIYKWLKIFAIVFPTVFGISLFGMYKSAMDQLKYLLINRISEEFRQPSISKTIQDVAANNAKQIFKDEIKPEVDKFKSDIRCEIDKFEKNVTERIDIIANNKQIQLKQEYPNGYAVLGFPSGEGVVIPKAFVPEGVEVDWSKTKIEEISKDNITIKFPDIRSKNFNFIESKVILDKKVGSKLQIAQTPGWLLYAEIIAIEKDLIIVVVGFEQIK